MSRSSSSSSSSRSRSYSSPKFPIRLPSINRPIPSIYKLPPAPIAAPVAAPSPGFFSNMWQGFGLGAGQAIAHNIFRSNPTVITPAPTQPISEYEECMKKKFNDRTLCIEFSEEFKQCMKENNDDKAVCKEQLINK
jgi:hypothetical protein